MTKQTDALALALVALEAHADIGIKSDKAIAAIKEALAEPEQQYAKEADAVEALTEEGWIWDDDQWQRPPQREWVGLTNADIESLMDDYDVAGYDYPRAIEAKLKEKNMDRQCPSCGGFCKKSGCERENVEPKWRSISEKDMDEIIEQRHFHKDYQRKRSDVTCIEWFKMGARWAEATLGERNK